MAKAAKTRIRDNPEVRRAQILDEAIRIIGRHGYRGFSIDELADRCALTSGGLLYHFNTKETLLLAVLDERDRRFQMTLGPMLEKFSAVDKSGASPSYPIAMGLLREIVIQSAKQPELVRVYAVLQSEALDPTHPGYNYFCEREERNIKVFARIVTGLVDHPLSTARQIQAVILGQQLQWLRTGFGFDLLKEWDRAITKLLPKKSLANRPCRARKIR
jgi:AcrR family transcriptional regulator